MRDSTKLLLMRHEHTANTVTKTRQRQAQDFRRQVDDRKSELERLERKLFATSNHHTISLIINKVLVLNPDQKMLLLPIVQIKPLYARAVWIR